MNQLILYNSKFKVKITSHSFISTHCEPNTSYAWKLSVSFQRVHSQYRARTQHLSSEHKAQHSFHLKATFGYLPSVLSLLEMRCLSPWAVH